MAKRQLKFITIPIALWESTDLTLTEKRLLIDIDSICEYPEGVAIGVQALASLSGLTQKEVKQSLNELFLKGAVEVSLDEDGAKLIKPLLYKERYVKRGEKVLFGDTPTDSQALPYDDILEAWNSICTTLPPLTRWTPQRKSKLRSGLKQADITPDGLIKCFRIIMSVPFLSGESNQFKASFDWLIKKSTNISKVYEGFYSNSYQEKQAYAAIMNGTTVKPKEEDDYYR